MDTRQLYVNGESIYPETNYEKDKVPEQILEIRELIRGITIRITDELLHNDAIAAWAKQLQKPTYTASEVGADASGSASKALADAKEYADDTYRQATGYTDSVIAALINGAPSTRDTLKEIADAMAENEDVVQALEAAIGTRANEAEFQAHTGNETVHVTASEKEKINEIDAIKQSFQNGCSIISSALTSLGIATAENASPEVIAANIQQMYDTRYNAGAGASKVGTATADKVLSGYSFTNADGVGIDGSMPNRGAVSQTLNCGGSYTIPKGYHDGSGKVTANSLTSQTQATAAAANITNGKTAYVNGTKITGTGADNTTNYNNGYNAGVTAADARVNTASANYKGGYNAGLAAGAASGNYNIALTLGAKVYNGTNKVQGDSIIGTINIYVRNGQVSTDYTGTGSVDDINEHSFGSFSGSAGWHMLYIASLTIAKV